MLAEAGLVRAAILPWGSAGFEPEAGCRVRTVSQLKPMCTSVSARLRARNALADVGERWRGLERAMGIEPTLVAWEATVLPLNYARAVPKF